VVREHFKDLGTFNVKCLQAALTTFPRAREVTLAAPFEEWEPGEKEAVVQWLCEGGRGSDLQGIMTEDWLGPAPELVHEALQAGALPSLKRVGASLEDETQRSSLRQGFLRAVHDWG
jgi:hypothetical protein